MFPVLQSRAGILIVQGGKIYVYHLLIAKLPTLWEKFLPNVIKIQVKYWGSFLWDTVFINDCLLPTSRSSIEAAKLTTLIILDWRLSLICPTLL